jgi:hypothetical protein
MAPADEDGNGVVRLVTLRDEIEFLQVWRDGGGLVCWRVISAIDFD